MENAVLSADVVASAIDEAVGALTVTRVQSETIDRDIKRLRAELERLINTFAADGTPAIAEAVRDRQARLLALERTLRVNWPHH